MEKIDNPEIYTVDNPFDFSKLLLMQPNGIQGGSYFTKIQINHQPFYLQCPKCTTKSGVVITNGKKSYIDFIFSNEDNTFIEFIENLEKTCSDKIYEKKDLWFNSDIELSDIENLNHPIYNRIKNEYGNNMKRFITSNGQRMYYEFRPLFRNIIIIDFIKVINRIFCTR